MTVQRDCDAACWQCGLLVAARATGALAGAHLAWTALWYEVPGT